MTITELINKVSIEIKNWMDEFEFDTFEEMCRCYDWDSYGSRVEIMCTANKIINDDYDEFVDKFGLEYAINNYRGIIMDDFGYLYDTNSNEEMQFRSFKNKVLSNLK